MADSSNPRMSAAEKLRRYEEWLKEPDMTPESAKHCTLLDEFDHLASKLESRVYGTQSVEIIVQINRSLGDVLERSET